MDKILKILIGLTVLIPIALILLVRFTDGTISDGDEIILGYDESKSKFQFFEKKTYEIDGTDGPYIIDNKIIRVDKNNKITIHENNTDSIEVLVNGRKQDKFYVRLKNDIKVSNDKYVLPEKIIAISDIEGNFEGLSGFLEKNSVIDNNFKWIFGDGHLVLLGDFIDRGNNVIPTLWLIYKLEAEAEKHGGKVHFILGNHEIMNIQGDWRYAKSRYKKIAQEIGGHKNTEKNYRVIYSKNSHLGKWLRSKNIIEKIGQYIFVHGGLSPELLELDFDISGMNTILRKNIDLNSKADKKVNFLMGSHSPFWYRGLVHNYEYYNKIEEDQLDNILRKYNSNQIIIGHSIVENISTDFNGKVIRIDVKHGKEKFSGKTKGLLIENNKSFAINDLGQKREL